MFYKIGDLGRMFGLSNETLRYYEKKGILHSHRDEATNYRYYDVMDVYRLGIIRNVRNMGMSLNDSIAFHKGASQKEILSLCEKRHQELQREIKLRQLIDGRLEESLAQVQRLHREGLTFMVCESPAFLRFEAGEGKMPIMEKETRTQGLSWMQNLFLVEPCTMLYRQEDGSWKKTKGLLTTREIHDLLGLEDSDYVKEIPRMKAVNFVIDTKGGGNCWDDGLREKLEGFMAEKSLCYNGDPFYRSILYYYDDQGIFNNYLEYFVPVCESNRLQNNF